MLSLPGHFVPNPVQVHYRTKPGAMRRRPLSIHTSYDADGNRIAKFQSTTGALDGTATDITTYKWNEKNQLTAVDQYSTYADYLAGTDSSEIDYGYDAFGNMVSRSPSGISGESPEFFVYDGGNVALILDSDGGVIQRNLDGAVDQVFASEAGTASSTLTPGTVDWFMTDNQGTVRDVVQFGAVSGGGSGGFVVDHLVYDSFGQMTSQTNSLYQPTVMYAGMQYDADAGMYYDKARWYDAVDAVFAGPDPLGFLAGQTNLEEYCGNSPANFTDPTGMTQKTWNQMTYAESEAAQPTFRTSGFHFLRISRRRQVSGVVLGW